MEAIVRVFESQNANIKNFILKGTFDIKGADSLEEVKDRFFKFSNEFEEKLADLKSKNAFLFLKDFTLQSVGDETFFWSALLFSRKNDKSTSPMIKDHMAFVSDVTKDPSSVSNKKLGMWQNTYEKWIIDAPALTDDMLDFFGLNKKEYKKAYAKLARGSKRTYAEYSVKRVLDIIFPFSYKENTYYFLLEGMSLTYWQRI